MLHPKFKKSDFYEKCHDFFDIFVHVHDILLALLQYPLLSCTILDYSTIHKSIWSHKNIMCVHENVKKVTKFFIKVSFFEFWV